MPHLFILVLVLATLAPIRSTSETDVDSCRFFNESQSYVDFVLEMELEESEIQFRIPVVFFEDRWKRVSGVTTTARFFSVDVDSFEPRTRAQNGELNKNGQLNSVIFVISDLLNGDELADSLVASAQRWQNKVPFKSLDQLDYGHGLREVSLPVKTGQRLFVGKTEKPAGQTFLTCSGDLQRVARKGCIQWFRSTAGVDVYAAYAMSDIDRWRDIQRMIDQFLDCAKVGI